MRILLIEDDKNMCRALAWQFEQNKDKIDCCHNGTDALLYTKTDSYDLILLDCILPEVSGLTVPKDLRARRNYTPVIILSALGEVENRIEGLNAGADDYLVKPFEFEELLARIRSIFRRKNSFMENHAAFGDLTLNITENILSAGKKTCSLSHTEGELMRLLLAALLSVSFLMSAKQQYTMILSTFSGQAYTIREEIRRQNVLTSSWLESQENSGGYYLFLTDNAVFI